jgi:hypothetical protein
LNDLGHSHAAQCVLETILAQSGWLDELKRG